MKSELEKLVALQELDVKIRKIEQEIADIPNQEAQIENQFNASAADYLAKKNQLEATRREHVELEQELRALEEKLGKYKEDLMRVRNEREYSTALREIDATKKTISRLETETLQKLELTETLEKQIEILTPEIGLKRREFDGLIEKCSARMDKLTTDLEAVGKQRARLVETISPEVLVQYNRLGQLRNGLALAEIRDGSCTACFMTVRPQAYADVRKGKEILTCDNCGRILYYRGAGELSESRSAS